MSDEEIRAKAIKLNPGQRTYYAMTLLSVLVATVGRLLDAPAIVVGSMVIAPRSAPRSPRASAWRSATAA